MFGTGFDVVPWWSCSCLEILQYFSLFWVSFQSFHNNFMSGQKSFFGCQPEMGNFDAIKFCTAQYQTIKTVEFLNFWKPQIIYQRFTYYMYTVKSQYDKVKFYMWAALWQNQQNGMCAQRRLSSAWAFAQSDQSSLSAWRKLVSLATNWAHSESSDQTGRMPRLIWVFAGHTWHFIGFVTRRPILYLCHSLSELLAQNEWNIVERPQNPTVKQTGTVDQSDVRLMWSWVRSSCLATFFRGDWSWNNFYDHSLPSADSRRAVVITGKRICTKYW